MKASINLLDMSAYNAMVILENENGNKRCYMLKVRDWACPWTGEMYVTLAENPEQSFTIETRYVINMALLEFQGWSEECRTKIQRFSGRS